MARTVAALDVILTLTLAGIHVVGGKSRARARPSAVARHGIANIKRISVPVHIVDKLEVVPVSICGIVPMITGDM